MPSFVSFFTSLLSFQSGGDNGEPFTHIEQETSRTSIFTSGSGLVPGMPNNLFNFRGMAASNTAIPAYYNATNTTGATGLNTTATPDNNYTNTTGVPVSNTTTSNNNSANTTGAPETNSTFTPTYSASNSSSNGTANGTVSSDQIVLVIQSNISSDNLTNASNMTTTYAPVGYEYNSSSTTNNSSNNGTGSPAAFRPRVFLIQSNVSSSSDNVTDSGNMTTTLAPIAVDQVSSSFEYNANTTASPDYYNATIITTGAPESQLNYSTASFNTSGSTNESTTQVTSDAAAENFLILLDQTSSTEASTTSAPSAQNSTDTTKAPEGFSSESTTVLENFLILLDQTTSTDVTTSAPSAHNSTETTNAPEVSSSASTTVLENFLIPLENIQP